MVHSHAMMALCCTRDKERASVSERVWKFMRGAHTYVGSLTSKPALRTCGRHGVTVDDAESPECHKCVGSCDEQWWWWWRRGWMPVVLLLCFPNITHDASLFFVVGGGPCIHRDASPPFSSCSYRNSGCNRTVMHTSALSLITV